MKDRTSPNGQADRLGLTYARLFTYVSTVALGTEDNLRLAQSALFHAGRAMALHLKGESWEAAEAYYDAITYTVRLISAKRAYEYRRIHCHKTAWDIAEQIAESVAMSTV